MNDYYSTLSDKELNQSKSKNKSNKKKSVRHLTRKFNLDLSKRDWEEIRKFIFWTTDSRDISLEIARRRMEDAFTPRIRMLLKKQIPSGSKSEPE